MIDAGKTLVDLVGYCGDLGDSEAVETSGVLGYISFSACGIGEKVNATGDLALRVFCPYLPNQAGLFGDIGGEVSVSGFSIGTERTG